MQNLKLVIEYDGTSYVGWQIQPNGPSIQGELEKALEQILQISVSTVAAGRTDAGVHARGQVVSFKIEKANEPEAILRGLNGVLPSDIRILSIETVPDDFHARYSARARVYKYFLQLKPSAISRNFGWYVGGFDIQRVLLDKCSALLLGSQDYSSFCKSDSEAKDFNCTVEKAFWMSDGSNLVFEIRANRFLYGMVRALVGTMVEVARGHRVFDDFQNILTAKNRTSAGMSAPARGLFLEQVIY